MLGKRRLICHLLQQHTPNVAAACTSAMLVGDSEYDARIPVGASSVARNCFSYSVTPVVHGPREVALETAAEIVTTSTGGQARVQSVSTSLRPGSAIHPFIRALGHQRLGTFFPSQDDLMPFSHFPRHYVCPDLYWYGSHVFARPLDLLGPCRQLSAAVPILGQ